MIADPTAVRFPDPALPGVVWERTGVCNRCGDCCRSGDPFGTGHAGCPLLAELADGTTYCTVWGTDNPYWQNACRIWPSEPAHVVDYSRCSFRFRRVEG